MIIAVQGTAKTEPIGIGALTSLVTSCSLNARTLVLQVTNPNNELISSVIDGSRDESIDKSRFDFKKTGIDFLLNECKDSKDLPKDLISEKSTTIIAPKGEPLLEVCPASELENFEDELLEDLSAFDTLLDVAQTEYDFIFILMPQNVELKKELLKRAHINLFCVPQGDKTDILTFNDVDISGLSDKEEEEWKNKKDIIIIDDYEQETRYTVKKAKRDYNSKRVYVCLHNAGYKDAFLSKSIASFVRNNINVTDEYDVNYTFFAELKSMIKEFAIGELAEEIEDLSVLCEFLPALEGREVPARAALGEFDIDFEITTKKDFFGREKEVVNVINKGDLQYYERKPEEVGEVVETKEEVKTEKKAKGRPKKTKAASNNK